MTSIWVLEQGDYSDYRVVGVFSCRENAEAALAYMVSCREYLSEDDKPTVTEWPLDPAISEINQGLRQYAVYMDDNGDSSCRLANEYDFDDLMESGDRDGRSFRVFWATDEKHAVKIANERRLLRLALAWQA